MNVSVDFASAADDPALRRLLRDQPMPGRVKIAFCREPDFSLGCSVTGDDPRILVARAAAGGEIVGVACRSTRDVFVNGRRQRIGYLGQLRVDDRHRGRWLVSRGFAMLAELDRREPLPAYLASIVDGNDEALGVLVRRARRGFPRFHEIARYVTLALRVGRTKRPLSAGVEIVAGSDDLRAPVAEFLSNEGARRHLHTVWTEDALGRLASYGLSAGDIRVAKRRGHIVGVLALWDQSAFKQSVIRGYSGWLRAAAPLLPRPGTALRSAYASLCCVSGDDADVFEALLREVYNVAAFRGVEYLLVGMDTRDPLLAAAKRYSHIAYPSRLYFASWADGGLHEPLDARPAYVDIATL